MGGILEKKKNLGNGEIKHINRIIEALNPLRAGRFWKEPIVEKDDVVCMKTYVMVDDQNRQNTETESRSKDDFNVKPSFKSDFLKLNILELIKLKDSSFNSKGEFVKTVSEGTTQADYDFLKSNINWMEVMRQGDGNLSPLKFAYKSNREVNSEFHVEDLKKGHLFSKKYIVEKATMIKVAEPEPEYVINDPSRFKTYTDDGYEPVHHSRAHRPIRTIEKKKEKEIVLVRRPERTNKKDWKRVKYVKPEDDEDVIVRTTEDLARVTYVGETDEEYVKDWGHRPKDFLTQELIKENLRVRGGLKLKLKKKTGEESPEKKDYELSQNEVKIDWNTFINKHKDEKDKVAR